MAQYCLLVSVILFATLQIVYCVAGNDSFDSFGPKIAKNAEPKEGDFSTDRAFFFENHNAPFDDKIIEKRRLFFNDGRDISPPLSTETESENENFARRTNYSEAEKENVASEYHQGYNNWENTSKRLYQPVESGNSRSFPDIRLRQPIPVQTATVGQVEQANQNYNWEQNNFFAKNRPRQWDKEEIFRQNANPESDPRIGDSYNNRPVAIPNNRAVNENMDNRNNDMFNRRVSITTFKDAEVQNEKTYNDEIVGEMNPGRTGFISSNNYNRYPKSYWNPNFYRPEKGVVINLNTECPTPKQFNSQLVHKFFFTPKTSLNTPEISTFHLPETTLFSSQKITPTYYL